MNKTIRKFFITLLALTAVVLGVLAFTACGGSGKSNKITSLTVENARIDFRIGDEFELGEDFTVYANYGDGTQVDVTEEAEIRKEIGFDMNVAGDYQITVSYGGKKEVYTVYVNEFESILRKIELDTTAAKVSFKVGEAVSFEGLVLRCTHENAQGIMVQSQTTSLKNFSTTVRDKSGAVVTDVFTDFGDYTVTVAQGGVKASYTVKVEGVDVSTVRSALVVGTAFRNKVVSGTQHSEVAMIGGSLGDDFHHEYKFGNNYTYVKETEYSGKFGNTINEYHCSIINDDIFCVKLIDEQIVEADGVRLGMMDGAQFLIWFSTMRGNGIENALNNIYTEALVCTNDDLVETADEENRTYSFKFSGLVFRSVNSDYFEQTITFRLSEDYFIEHVEINQSAWENNLDNPGVKHTFETDANGKTKPTDRFTSKIRIVADQVGGVRDEENPYTPEMFQFSSYDVKYNGSTLSEDPVIKCKVGDSLNFYLANFQPALASFAQDPLMMNYGGSHDIDSGVTIVCDGFVANFYSGLNNIGVRIDNGGVWTLLLKTARMTKTITFDVTGINPTSMTARLRNDVGGWYNGNAKTLVIGAEAYFYGEVNQYANPAQTAAVTSGNSANATISEVTENGVKCFKFSASAEGTYTVKVSSTAAGSVYSTFTFTVNDMPDFGNILKGSYTATNTSQSVFTFAFTPENSGGQFNGTVTVTRTTEDEHGGNPEVKSQTLSYSVDNSSGQINLTHVSGDNLGVSLLVNASGNFAMKDHYNDEYVLTAVS